MMSTAPPALGSGGYGQAGPGPSHPSELELMVEHALSFMSEEIDLLRELAQPVG